MQRESVVQCREWLRLMTLSDEWSTKATLCALCSLLRHDADLVKASRQSNNSDLLS